MSTLRQACGKVREPMTAAAPAPVMYRIRDVVELTRLSRSVIYEQIKAGRLRTVKQGRATFVTAIDLHDYVQLLRQEAREARGLR